MDAHILIVDDEQAVSSMLKVVFENQGYAVTTASSAAQACSLLAVQTFDVVMTDMRMESDNAGFDVARAARKRSDASVIVILTAFPLLAKDWRAAGADAAFTKPSNMAVLLATVRELLDQHGQRSTPLS
ncbi:MAG: response regulator [Acidobacteriia bacterium]|nr:response regulator [Terriglobia bacterium]